MSPVHSSSTVGIVIHRRRVSPTAARLFPECPSDVSPMTVVGGCLTSDRKTVDVPAADQHGSIADRTTTDCPPTSPITSGTQSRSKDPVCDDSVVPLERANARLVGIARLAACSPPAETRRKSPERPEYFVLPVRSILNRCDSNRVPFEWTINP